MGRRDGPHEMEKKKPQTDGRWRPRRRYFRRRSVSRRHFLSLSRRPTKRATEAGHLGLVAFTAFLHFFFTISSCWIGFFLLDSQLGLGSQRISKVFVLLCGLYG